METTSKKRNVTKFSWSTVDDALLVEILKASYASTGQLEEVAKVDSLSRDALLATANERLDRPPRKEVFTPKMYQVLRDVWLPRAEREVLDQLTVLVLLTASESAKAEPRRTKGELVAFLQNRKLTQNYTGNLRKAFLRAHKETERVDVVPSVKRELERIRVLEGAGAPLLHPAYPHQIKAQERFSELASTGKLRGHLVFPTGAGKTNTVVVWLLEQMNADSALRVLWLVHQQELAQQAVASFEARAVEQPAEFKRFLKMFHSSAAQLTAMPDPELDVAVATYQSFKSMPAQKRRILDAFFERPTIVVIDEAHHAGAPTYHALLEHIGSKENLRGLIGLTATPYPAGSQARARFAQWFPELIAEVSVGEMIRTEVLASPIVTTIDTGVVLELTDDEVAQAEVSDIPDPLLKRLDVHNRNHLVVRSWREEFGKTLAFVPTIHHADSLTKMFIAAGADAKALHSRTSDRRGVVEWFRKATGPCVLVSVGMLTEGVDLPDARSAFVARPTTSPILMRQMVGRVLRGPKAGGDRDAHVVYFRDTWTNLPDVISPEEVLPESTRTLQSREETPWQFGGIIDDNKLAIRADQAAQVKKAFDRLAHFFNVDDNDPYNDRPPEPLLSRARLVGFYNLGSYELPVFEHQEAGFEALTEDALASGVKVGALLSYFDDQPPPYPSRRSLRDFVDLVRSLHEPPELLPCPAEFGPRRAADMIRNAGALTLQERTKLIEDAFRQSLNSQAYPSFDRFSEAVDQELREGQRAVPRLDPEAPRQPRPPQDKSRTPLPPLPRSERSLEDPTASALAEARRLLPSEIGMRLSAPPPVQWTARTLKSLFASWTIKQSGRGRGRAVIRVNSVLKTSPEIVPDALLAYLIYHEMLHHLLPGQGHDAEFRELEGLWPDAVNLDMLLDTLDDNWDLDPSRYNATA